MGVKLKTGKPGKASGARTRALRVMATPFGDLMEAVCRENNIRPRDLLLAIDDFGPSPDEEVDETQFVETEPEAVDEAPEEPEEGEEPVKPRKAAKDGLRLTTIVPAFNAGKATPEMRRAAEGAFRKADALGVALTNTLLYEAREVVHSWLEISGVPHSVVNVWVNGDGTCDAHVYVTKRDGAQTFEEEGDTFEDAIAEALMADAVEELKGDKGWRHFRAANINQEPRWKGFVTFVGTRE